MKIKELTPTSTGQVLGKRLLQSRWIQSKWVLGIAGLFFTFFTFLIGAAASYYNHFDPDQFMYRMHHFGSAIFNKTRSHLFVKPEQLFIEIKHKDYQWLAYKREKALIRKILVSEENDFVPARIRYNGNVIKVRLRLKGDGIDNLTTDKWSFRVETKDNSVIKGLSVFSIQHPLTRNYVTEWFYHEALKREGILALNYDFIEVIINGKSKGIFAFEEHFSKELIERNRLRDGPILKFEENLLFGRWHDTLEYKSAELFSDATFFSSQIDAFQTNKIQKDTLQQKYFLHAMSLLESFRKKEKKAHEVFDVDEFAHYLAITELLGAQHGARWGNIRFYYNPITSRLHPIGYDGYAGVQTTKLWATIQNQLKTDPLEQIQLLLMEDEHLFEAYIGALEEISSPAYLEKLYTENQKALDRHLDVIYRDHPLYEFPFENFERNRAFIEYMLYPTEGLRAHLVAQDQDSIHLEVGSTQAIPVEVRHISLKDSLIFPITQRTVVHYRHMDKGITYLPLTIPSPRNISLTDSLLAADLSITYSLLGADSLRKVQVIPHPSSVQNYLEGDLTRHPSNSDRFEFLEHDAGNRTITARPGAWTIKENLLLPEGYTFRVTPATSFDLTHSALILARGPLHWTGTADAPIRLYSSDSTGQGLVVLGADSLSIVQYATFENLKSANKNAWNLTGALTFHESPVHFGNVTFSHSQAEDALNLIRTNFSIENARFEDSFSDALDADFASGKISNTLFYRCGNDGIDISGTELNLENIVIEEAGDKALSAGEFSTLLGHRILIDASEIAVASKDQSTISLKEGRITNSRVGFAIFQKKPEYGPATADTENLILKGLEVPVLLQKGSQLLLNGELIEANQEDVSVLLYGNLYGTASE